MKKIRILTALLLTLCMAGTTVCCFADAERFCNMNGEIRVNYDDGNGGYTQTTLQNPELNEDVTSTGGQESLIGSDGAVSALNTEVLMNTTAPAASEVTVNGNVSCEADWVAGGVKAEADAGSAKATVDGDVSAVSYADTQSWFDMVSQTGGVQTSSSAYGVAAQSSGAGTHATASVTGDVSAEANEKAGHETDNIFAQGLVITAGSDGTSEVSVGGNVDVKSDRYASGVDISGGDMFARPASGESHVQAEVDGNVTVEGAVMAVGVNMQGWSDPMSDPIADWTVKISGDITATTTAAENVIREDGSSANTINVQDGSQSGSGPDSGPQSGPGSGPDSTPPSAPSSGPDAAPGAGPDSGPDAALSSGPDSGPDAVLSSGPDSSPDSGPQSGAGPEITRTEPTNAAGVIISIEEGTASAVVDGNITAIGAGNATGADLYAEGKSTVSLEVTGDITATAEMDAIGAQAMVSDGGTVTLAVSGDISAEGKEESTGAALINNGGTIEMTQTGDIDSDGNGLVIIDAASIGFDPALAGTKVTVDKSEYTDLTRYEDKDGNVRDVYRHENEDGTYYDYLDDGTVLGGTGIMDHDPGTTSVTITGDVTAVETGAYIDLSNNKSQIDLIVDGTLSGETQSVLVSEETIADNLTLTVWEIKPNDDGNLVERVEEYDDSGEAVSAADTNIEKNIQYIIKVEPTQKEIIKTQGTTNYEGYDVAKEGDTVTLQVQVPNGYRIKSAFSDTDQTVSLAQDADGNYYLIVPRGGAVMLSVEFEKIPDPVPNPESEAESKPAANSTPAAVSNPATGSNPAPKPEVKSEPQAETAAAATAATGTTAPVVTVVTKVAFMKPADETSETSALKDLVGNNDLLKILPDEIKAQLPDGIGKVVEAVTMTLGNYDASMGSVTLKVSVKQTFTKGEKATVIIALPDGSGGYIFFYIDATAQEDGTLNLTIPAATAKALANQTFVLLIPER